MEFGFLPRDRPAWRTLVDRRLRLLDTLRREREMHYYSAKRGIAIRLSVCNVGASASPRLESSKTNCTLFVAQMPPTYSQRNMGTFWRDWRWGGKKVACWSTKATISLKRVKIEETLLRSAYRNLPTLFQTVPSRPPTASSSPRLGFATPAPNTSIAII